MMKYIDADSHIEESDVCWQFLTGDYKERCPRAIAIGEIIPQRPLRDWVWLVDGEMIPKHMGTRTTCFGTPTSTRFAHAKPFSIGNQDLSDVKARLAYLDNNGLDVSVLYSTFFLQRTTEDPYFEAAMMTSWNRYMSQQCSQSDGRIKFGACVPIAEPHLAIEELRRIKELPGAVSAMVLPCTSQGFLHDKRYDRFWAAAEDLDVPISVHVGYAGPLHALCATPAASQVLVFEMSVMLGFFSFLAGGILDRFPRLRVGFFEGGFEWFEVALRRMEHWHKTPTAQPWPAQRAPSEYLAERAVYFSFEGDEPDVRDLMKIVGDHRVMAAADFPHVHYAEGVVSDIYHQIKATPKLTDDQKRAGMADNARQFYGI